MATAATPGRGRDLVVVVGGMGMDIQGRSAEAFRSGDSNPGIVTTSPGGVGRNIAENLDRLGFEVELVTALGDDCLSRQLEEDCYDVGIGLSGAVRVAGGKSPVYLCILEPDGGFLGAVISMEAMDGLSPDRLEERIGLLDRAWGIVVDANVPEKSIEWIAGRYGGRGNGPLLVLDPVSVAKASRFANHLGAFDMAKPNLAEARILAGMPGEKDPATLAEAIRGKGLREIVISLGSDGIYHQSADRSGIEAKGKISLPDTSKPDLSPRNMSGAGDAACAALVWAFAEGLGPEDRARAALAAAMLAAASDATVNPAISPGLLRETARSLAPR